MLLPWCHGSCQKGTSQIRLRGLSRYLGSPPFCHPSQSCGAVPPRSYLVEPLWCLMLSGRKLSHLSLRGPRKTQIATGDLRGTPGARSAQARVRLGGALRMRLRTVWRLKTGQDPRGGLKPSPLNPEA